MKKNRALKSVKMGVIASLIVLGLSAAIVLPGSSQAAGSTGNVSDKVRNSVAYQVYLVETNAAHLTYETRRNALYAVLAAENNPYVTQAQRDAARAKFHRGAQEAADQLQASLEAARAKFHQNYHG